MRLAADTYAAMFNRISRYFDVPLHEQPHSLVKLGLGIGIGWFSAKTFVAFIASVIGLAFRYLTGI